MAWGDRFYRKLTDKVEQRVGEPIEVIGIGSRCGATNAVISGGALSGAESALGSAVVAGSKAPSGRLRTPEPGKGVRLPMSFVVALTPTALHVLKWHKTWFGVKVNKELGVIPRAGLRLEVSDRGIVKRFHLTRPDGWALAFEMTRIRFTSNFAHALEAALAEIHG